jgi:hypothetical protein
MRVVRPERRTLGYLGRGEQQQMTAVAARLACKISVYIFRKAALRTPGRRRSAATAAAARLAQDAKVILTPTCVLH